MAIAVSLLPEMSDQSLFDEGRTDFTVYGFLTLTGNYGGVSTHGDTVDFSKLGIPTQSLPRMVSIYETPPAGTAPNGYIFNYCPGTTLANGVVTILNNLTEYTQGSAYSAGLLAAVIRFQLIIQSYT